VIPPLGLVHSEDDDDDGRDPAYRDGWRDVKILWAVLLVVVLIAVL
jgi:hypothetical protein